MIYFLKALQFSENIKAGWIKIGTTIYLSERLKQIMYEIGHKPALLGVLDGSHAEERAIHGRFAESRRYGEWFDPEGSGLVAMIESEARPWDGKDESPRKYTAVARLESDALEQARLAASLMKMSLAGYMTDLIWENSPKDIEREIAKISEASNASKPARGPKES